MFVVDAGDLMWNTPALSEGRRAQQRLKGQLQLHSFQVAGVDALLPGDGDLALGVDWLLAEAQKWQSPYVATNLRCDGQAPFPASRRIERDGITLGVIGVLGADIKVPTGCVLDEPVEAARKASAELGEVDVLIALSHSEPAADEALAGAIPSLDLVVNAGAGASYATPRALPKNALMVAAGTRGKKLGIAQIQLREGGDGFEARDSHAQLAEKVDRYRERLAKAKEDPGTTTSEKNRARIERRVDFYTKEIAKVEGELAQLGAVEAGTRHLLGNDLRPLGASIADHAATAALLEEAMAGINALEANEQAERYEGPYLGSRACAACHREQSAQWGQTPHAKAYSALEEDNRQLDRDCYPCHITGGHDPVGPDQPSQILGLENVGCESCHGPGREHVKDPANNDMIQSPGLETCTSCHDGERDEGRFDAATYLPQVQHSSAAP